MFETFIENVATKMLGRALNATLVTITALMVNNHLMSNVQATGLMDNIMSWAPTAILAGITALLNWWQHRKYKEIIDAPVSPVAPTQPTVEPEPAPSPEPTKNFHG